MTDSWVIGRHRRHPRWFPGALLLASAVVTAVALLVGGAAAASAAAAPSAPQSVRAATSTSTSTSAVLSWTAPSSTGGSAVTGYVVARDGIDSTGYGAWSGTVSATSTSVSFNQLVPGSTYRLSVRAVNAVGQGPAVTVTYTAPATAPSAPQSVRAATSTSTSTSAVLSWAAPASTGGSAITGYVVARDGKDSSGYGAWSGTVSASSRSVSFNLLVPGSTYRLSVRAVNAVGQGPAVTVTYAVPRPTAMPVGDLPGWKQVFTEDFAAPVALGSWPGSSYGTKWKDYTWDGTTGDTRKFGVWNTKADLSVANGVADYWLHSVNGVPQSAAIMPSLPSQTYGRYEVRFRVDSGLKDWASAWLLWPNDDKKWPAWGEMDWPEGDLSGSMQAFTHYADPNGGQEAFDSKVAFASGWHTATTEWLPGSVKYYLDGKLVGSSTTKVSSYPMHWVLQTETGYDRAPMTSGHVQIDWAVVYARA